MFLNLIEKRNDVFAKISLLDIADDDSHELPPINIIAPGHKHLAGSYTVWKFCEHGYVWSKRLPQSSIMMILYFVDNPDENSTRHIKGPKKSVARQYCCINQYSPALDSRSLQQIARGEFYDKHGQQQSKWYTQDQITLEWNKTQSISIEKM